MCLGAAFMLWGCGTMHKKIEIEPLPSLKIGHIFFKTDAIANNHTALTVDLVLMYDRILFEKIKEMSASQYFSSVDQLMLDNPTSLYTWRWELIPDQNHSCRIPPFFLTFGYGLLFLNLQEPGLHRANVGPLQAIYVEVKKKSFSLQQNTCPVTCQTSVSWPRNYGALKVFPKTKTQ